MGSSFSYDQETYKCCIQCSKRKQYHVVIDYLGTVCEKWSSILL